jgi:hypothetical protein
MFCFATGAARWLALACLISTPIACTCGKTESAKAGPKASTGVTRDQINGVKGACERKNTWKDRSRKKCTRCVALSSAPACACPADREPFSGICAKEQNKKINAKDCEDVWQCTYKCKDRTDCDCFAKCYDGRDDCHEIASAVDTCVVEVCDPLCK